MKNRKISIIATFALTLTVGLALALDAEASNLLELDLQNNLNNNALLGLNSGQVLLDLDSKTLVLDKNLSARLLSSNVLSNRVAGLDRLNPRPEILSIDLQDDVKEGLLLNKLQTNNLDGLLNKSLPNLDLDSANLLNGSVKRSLSLELPGENSDLLG